MKWLTSSQFSPSTKTNGRESHRKQNKEWIFVLTKESLMPGSSDLSLSGRRALFKTSRDSARITASFIWPKSSLYFFNISGLSNEHATPWSSHHPLDNGLDNLKDYLISKYLIHANIKQGGSQNSTMTHARWTGKTIRFRAPNSNCVHWFSVHGWQQASGKKPCLLHCPCVCWYLVCEWMPSDS